MQDLLEKAKVLGNAIGEHERTKAFTAADAAVHADDDAKAVMEAFHKQATHIQELESTQQPIEPDDKHKLADLQAQIAGNALIKEFTRRQADYAELMNHVNQAIEEAVGRAGKPSN